MDNELHNKIHEEYTKLLDDVRKLPPDEIISKAYEISMKADIEMIFEGDIDKNVSEQLCKLDYPLDEIYNQWLSNDYSHMDGLRDTVSDLSNIMITKDLEEKYNNPKTPVYKKTYSEAQKDNETMEWKVTSKRMEECVSYFHENAELQHMNKNLRGFMVDWVGKYGIERCMIVLAKNILSRPNDKRFSRESFERANKFSLNNAYGECVINTHSCVVNCCFEMLIEAERIQDKNQKSKSNVDKNHRKRTNTEVEKTEH